MHRDGKTGLGRAPARGAADALAAAGDQRRLRHRRSREARRSGAGAGRGLSAPGTPVLFRARILARTTSRADTPARPAIERPRGPARDPLGRRSAGSAELGLFEPA